MKGVFAGVVWCGVEMLEELLSFVGFVGSTCIRVGRERDYIYNS
jgi:hypothetical protein